MNKINSSIGQDPDSRALIGVLDIYGFESFKTNRCLTGMLLLSLCTDSFSGSQLRKSSPLLILAYTKMCY